MRASMAALRTESYKQALHAIVTTDFRAVLPKITVPEQVAALASVCHVFERAGDLAAGTLQIELMIEMPQAIVAEDGTVALPRLAMEGRGRVVAAHFGTYDYLAACGITAANQRMQHPFLSIATGRPLER